MGVSGVSKRSLLLVTLASLVLLASLSQAYPNGIGGTQSNAGETIDDVAKEGCLCHQANADNTVMILLDDTPHTYVAGETYDMRLEIIGGPATDYGGFSMRVSSGELSGDGDNWDGDTSTLTHNAPNSRVFVVSWTAPEAGTGSVNFWITGNAVNNAEGPAGDYWNQLTFVLMESAEDDGRGTRTMIAGSGAPEAPEKEAGQVDISTMGAGFRAHWLGLLGFGAVIAVVVFCGFLLRYGFSTSYKGRSNVLRLRYKLNRRGDQ